MLRVTARAGESVTCWFCEKVYVAKGYERPEDWFCDACFAEVGLNAHKLTQMAEDIGRQIMETDWHTRRMTVLNLLNIRSMISRARLAQEAGVTEADLERDPF